MPFFSKEKFHDSPQPQLTREEARQLFEFNTGHFSFSDYHHQTVLKTSKQLVAQHLMPNETDNLSLTFLLNYKTNNNYLGFRASVADFFTDSAVTTFTNSAFFEDKSRVIPLPKATKITTSLSTCIVNRRSHRQYIDLEMPLQDLANLLYYATGVSSKVQVKEEITKRNNFV